jgi:hypothetical protein
VSQELLWLYRGDTLGIQKGECPRLEAGTRGLVTAQQTGKAQCMCTEQQTV